MDLRFICGLFEGSKAVTPFSLEACVRDPKSSGSFSDTFVIFKVTIVFISLVKTPQFHHFQKILFDVFWDLTSFISTRDGVTKASITFSCHTCCDVC